MNSQSNFTPKSSAWEFQDIRNLEYLKNSNKTSYQIQEESLQELTGIQHFEQLTLRDFFWIIYFNLNK